MSASVDISHEFCEGEGPQGVFHAVSFTSVREAEQFTHTLTELRISFMVRLVMPRKRLKLPLETTVILLEGLDGVHH